MLPCRADTAETADRCEGEDGSRRDCVIRRAETYLLDLRDESLGSDFGFPVASSRVRVPDTSSSTSVRIFVGGIGGGWKGVSPRACRSEKSPTERSQTNPGPHGSRASSFRGKSERRSSSKTPDENETRMRLGGAITRSSEIFLKKNTGRSRLSSPSETF